MQEQDMGSRSPLILQKGDQLQMHIQSIMPMVQSTVTKLDL